jgi:hypothetical protein
MVNDDGEDEDFLDMVYRLIDSKPNDQAVFDALDPDTRGEFLVAVIRIWLRPHA